MGMKKDTSSVMKDVVTVERPQVDFEEESRSEEEEEVVDDWQDVTVARADENSVAEDTTNNNPLPTSGNVVVDESSYQHQQLECSYMGKHLAQESIASLARHQVRVQTPLAAIAVVLHAAL